MKNTSNYTILAIVIILCSFFSCQQPDSTPDRLKELKTQMISKPTEKQDSITHLLSNFFTDFIPATSNPEDFKYYSKLKGDNFILLIHIPWINTQPKNDQEAVARVVPMVLDLNETLANKNVYVGIYGKKGISIVKTPEGDYYGNDAQQNLLLNFFQ